MTVQTDVSNVQVAASGSAFASRARVKGIVITTTVATAGSVLLKDGGSGGTTLINIDTPAVVGTYSVTVPGEGVLFETDVYATLTNCKVSIFYA
jgi:hypothetical protein